VVTAVIMSDVRLTMDPTGGPEHLPQLQKANLIASLLPTRQEV